MKCRGAVLRNDDTWDVLDVELDDPKAGEVLVRFEYAGLCHSDVHFRRSYSGMPPLVAGHEGSGVVEAVGRDVTRVATGDHVVVFVVPSCGGCRWCSVGRPVLCSTLSNPDTGSLRDGTVRFRLEGRPIGAHCMLGTFARRSVVLEESCVRIDPDVPLDVAALVSCGVVTGWGAVVHAGGAKVGDTVAVIGVGGVGINAVQAAVLTGARNIIAVDPVELKRTAAARLGATHQVRTITDARHVVRSLNPSAGGADVTVVATGSTSEEILSGAFDLTGKGGTMVVVALNDDFDERTMRLAPSQLAVNEKRIQGCLMGSANYVYDIPMILDFYRSGRFQLDKLVSRHYELEQINQGFADMLAGRSMRGLIAHSD